MIGKKVWKYFYVLEEKTNWKENLAEFEYTQANKRDIEQVQFMSCVETKNVSSKRKEWEEHQFSFHSKSTTNDNKKNVLLKFKVFQFDD